ncbi:hypothetical protein K438DRAFT_1766004 [Mycena galopus ATCC 62051]|nr:hypothetical protein K438DRAFT_1766004 [Mycena galopus ATCC 62051]
MAVAVTIKCRETIEMWSGREVDTEGKIIGNRGRLRGRQEKKATRWSSQECSRNPVAGSKKEHITLEKNSEKPIPCGIPRPFEWSCFQGKRIEDEDSEAVLVAIVAENPLAHSEKHLLSCGDQKVPKKAEKTGGSKLSMPLRSHALMVISFIVNGRKDLASQIK